MSVDLLKPTEIGKELEERLFELKQALLKVKKASRKCAARPP